MAKTVKKETKEEIDGSGAKIETYTVEAPDAEPIDIMDYINEPDIRFGTSRRELITFKMADGTPVKAVIRPLSLDESTEINQYATNNGISGDKLVLQRALFATDGTTKLPDLFLEQLEGGIGNKIVTKIMEISGFNEDEAVVDVLKKN